MQGQNPRRGHGLICSEGHPPSLDKLFVRVMLSNKRHVYRKGMTESQRWNYKLQAMKAETRNKYTCTKLETALIRDIIGKVAKDPKPKRRHALVYGEEDISIYV